MIQKYIFIHLSKDDNKFILLYDFQTTNYEEELSIFLNSIYSNYTIRYVSIDNLLGSVRFNPYFSINSLTVNTSKKLNSISNDILTHFFDNEVSEDEFIEFFTNLSFQCYEVY